MKTVIIASLLLIVSGCSHSEVYKQCALLIQEDVILSNKAFDEQGIAYHKEYQKEADMMCGQSDESAANYVRIVKSSRPYIDKMIQEQNEVTQHP